MPESRLVPLPGSHRDAVQNAQPLGRAALDTDVELTVQLAPRDAEALAARARDAGSAPYTHDEFIAAHAPDDKAVAAVRAFLESHGLAVTDVSPDRRSLSVSGTLANVERCFGTELHAYESGGQQFHARSGPLSVPEDVAPLIEGVFGIDRRPFARPHLRRRGQHQKAGVATPLSALEVAAAYQFPMADGAGQTIGILELGGGYHDEDLQQYFGGLSLQVPQVTSVGVKGGANTPGGPPSGADGEVELDIEVAGAIAPAAAIAVYFGRDASEQSFVDVLNAIVNDSTNAPSIVSISWGGPELSATTAARGAMDTAFQAGASLGITFLAAAGDNGSADEPSGASVNVDYPASSPFVTSCGGTELILAGGKVASEVVWNEDKTGHGATGGGISAVYPVPAWQKSIMLPVSVAGNPASGRGVPDVSGNADPFTGYKVQVDGQSEPIGGTSAVAPLWAGLVARINSLSGKRLGFLNPMLYAAKGAGLNDITEGDNAASGVAGYKAGPGWDACTGWGTPDGQQLLDALVAQKA